MKFLYCTAVYPGYVSYLYGRNPLLELASYDEQLTRIDSDAFGWLGAWRPAMTPYGYEVHEIISNLAPLQRTWVWENARGRIDPDNQVAIAVAQAKRIAPEVLFVDHHDEELIRALREALPSLRLTIGWIGGTIDGHIPAWRHCDLVLSCAPESVDWLRRNGYRAELLEHSFNDAVVSHLSDCRKTRLATFFGQIVTCGAFHRERERFLEALCGSGLPLELHSPSYDYGWRDDVMVSARIGIWGAAQVAKKMRLPIGVVDRIPLIRRAYRWEGRPLYPVSRKLKPFLRPAVYGMAMYRAIASSLVSLNAHADSSIRFASNMRLFETAGSGTCLVTDWRENIPSLFEPDREIVTFRSLDECIEKIRWLLDHPAECESIGRAAQARTMRDHTVKRRAETLHATILDALAEASVVGTKA